MSVRQRGGIGRVVALTALLAVVGVAFADSSIVVLALPDLLRDFDVSIGSAAWVITAYNLVVAVGALLLARLGPWLRPGRMALLGSAGLLVSSVACAIAPENTTLIALRAVQGLGAVLLLVGSLPLVRARASSPARGNALWTGAGVLGAAAGPALGGALTELFDWRAIFFAQVPVAALATIVAFGLREQEDVRTPSPPVAARFSRSRLAAGAALALASAALVGLLFLAVVELIDVWRLTPLRAGGIVTVIPVATIAVAPLAASAGRAVVSAGAIMLAGGLVGMAFVPGTDLAWVLASLGLAGIGYGLLIPSVARAALSDHGSAAASAARTLSVRHLGLVAGLILLAPLLASDLGAAGTSAQLRGVAVILDSPIAPSSKLRAAVDLAPVLSSPARKGLPDFTAALAQRPAPVAGLGPQLDATVAATVTRAFRRTFLAAAIFALAAALPAWLMAAARPGRARRPLGAPAAALLAAGALLAAELSSDGLAYGTRPVLLPPCADRRQPEGHGTAAGAQRAAFTALDFVACRLHKSREQLVVDAARHGVGAYELLVRSERLASLTDRLAALLG